MISVTNRLVAIVVVGLLTIGCKSSGKPASEAVKATDSMAAVNADLANAQTQVDRIVASINQMQTGGDLKGAYAQYSDAVGDLKSTGERTAKRAESMRANREAYIQKWQKELEATETPEVRAALAERQAKVSANYNVIQQSGERVRDDYKPFIKNVEEIQRGLALDLNPSGVAAMRTPLDNAKAQGAALKSSMATFQSQLAEIAGRMTP